MDTASNSGEEEQESQHNLFSDSDADSSYQPQSSNSESSDSEVGPDLASEVNPEVEPEPRPWKERNKHKGKKRLRRSNNWARVRAKKARNEGQLYTDRKGTVHRSKHMENFNHNCRYKCNTNIPDDKRQCIFDSYWGLGSWDLQTSFLCSCISLQDPARKNPNATYVKKTSCTYTLERYRVCKAFFLKTLDVSNKRITNVINKKNTNTNSIAHTDKRGRKVPSNKTTDEAIQLINEHLKSLPKYSSHYSRIRCPNVKYLSTELSMKNISISKMECMHFEKAHPYRLFYKHSINIPNFHELNMKSSRAGRPRNELPLLAATGDMPKIKKLKFDNLQSLLPYVPPIYHDFFNTLQYINGPNNDPVEVNQDATDPLGDEEPENIFDSESED